MVLMKGVGSGMVDLMTSDLIFAGQFTDDVYTATRTPTIFPYHAFPSNRRRQVRLAIAGDFVWPRELSRQLLIYGCNLLARSAPRCMNCSGQPISADGVGMLLTIYDKNF